MRPYEVYLHIGLLDGVPRSGVRRRRIMEFIAGLRKNPHIPGDFIDKDASLRKRQIKLIGDHAITYWVDEPARTVMIVDISPAGK